MSNRNLKIKVSDGTWVIELEGDEEVVTREFEKIKANGLGKISHPGSVSSGPFKAEENQDTAGPTDASNSRYEHQYEPLKNVVLKHLPGPEAEWTLTYAFYLSGFGKDKFNRNALLVQYEETGRSTDSRKSNLHNNIRICIDKNWLRALNDDEFIVLDAGIKKAKEILSRTSAGKQRKTARRKTGGGQPEPGPERGE